MKKEKLRLMIVLPPQLADVPVVVKRGSCNRELICGMENAENGADCVNVLNRNYVFVWCRSEYAKLTLDEIMWLEADGSYCVIHLTGKRRMTISSPLAVAAEVLPHECFIRIHRSYMVNMRHVTFLVGNCMKVDERLLRIGQEYREAVLDRFIFLGVRRKNKE